MSMPKDSSVSLGATPQTNKIQAWLTIVGQTPITVLEAIELKTTTVTCIHGILAKITVETVTLKTGIEKELTTIAIAVPQKLSSIFNSGTSKDSPVSIGTTCCTPP